MGFWRQLKSFFTTRPRKLTVRAWFHGRALRSNRI
jgi:hypothetical protein